MLKEKFKELLKASKERKITTLKHLFERDSNYLRRLLVLFAMGDEAAPLIEKIAQNRKEEIELFKEIYQIEKIDFISLSDLKDLVKNRDFSEVMELFVGDEKIEGNYANACSEVLEILKYVPKEYYNKISKDFLKKLREDADGEYEFVINRNTPFSQITLLDETKELLALISDKFWREDDKDVSIEGIFDKE